MQRSEDTDFQLSKTTYEARWSGFDSGAQQITYKVGLGSRQGADDVASFVMVGTVTAYVFAGLSLQKNKVSKVNSYQHLKSGCKILRL